MINQEEQTKIPLNIPLDMIKDAIKTLPLEDIQVIKKIIDEVLEEYERGESK